MSTTTTDNAAAATGVESRLLKEAYGAGAWHGPDLKAALADVTPGLAFWRPAAGRHNIAEIAVHHAFCARNVHALISGTPSEAFVLEGEDWFELTNDGPLTWAQVQELVDATQRRLAALIADIEAGRAASRLTDDERYDVVLGITCHAIYHAGQVQLIKRLRA